MLLVLVFVVGLLVVFAGGYQLAEKKALAPKKERENYYLSESLANQPLACEALVTRVFEQRLVDAGILTVAEMTTCESPACKDCLPTHQAKKDKLAQEHKALAEEQKKKRLGLPAPGSRPRTLKIHEGGKHKREIPWPESVPEFAHFVVDDNDLHTKRLVFTWTNPEDGRTYSKTMLIPILSNIEVGWTDEGKSKPVSQWSPPTHAGSDPVRRPMAGKSRAEAIAELRKNPPKPPKGKGGGSPMTPERRKAAIESLTRKRT